MEYQSKTQVATVPWRPLPRVPEGVLFIGDPHAWSRQPGRRRDASFLATVLGKLSQAAAIANERHLIPVILGDLLHDDEDNDLAMIIQLARCLRDFWMPPLTLVGNHDKNGEMLTEDNALMLLGEMGVVELLDRPGFWGCVEVVSGQARHRIAIGASPYGSPLPSDVATYAGLEHTPDHDRTLVARTLGVDAVVWLTHEDLAFEGAYPGAQELFEMRGVDMVVNGHMHGTNTPVKKGTTAWYNPGNITRLSIDQARHRPSVWAFVPAQEARMASASGEAVPLLEQVVLVHEDAERIFDFEGRNAKAALVLAPVLDDAQSAFVACLREDDAGRRTDDATFVQEAFEEYRAAHPLAEPVVDIVQSLMERAVRHG